jgi:hypothetical protein
MFNDGPHIVAADARTYHAEQRVTAVPDGRLRIARGAMLWRHEGRRMARRQEPSDAAA